MMTTIPIRAAAMNGRIAEMATIAAQADHPAATVHEDVRRERQDQPERIR